MKLSQVEWGPVLKASAKEYTNDDVPGLAAEMAYWIIFSIFPFFAFLTALFGIVGQFVGPANVMQTVTQEVLGPLPAATRETLQGPLETLLSAEGSALSIGALFTALIALNTASTAVLTVMKAFNRAYGIEETRNFVVARLTAVGLTLVMVVLLVGGTLLLSLGGKLADLFDFGGLGRVLLFIVRIVGAAGGISLALAILYWKGPNLKQQFQWISPGSIVATLALIVFSGAFGLYVNLIGASSTGKTYGTLAGVIIFLLFLRLASTIVLMGAEFNAETAKRYDPEAIRDKITDSRKQLPGQQPMPHPQAMAEAGVTREQVEASNRQSAQKLVAGEGSPASATMAMQAQNNTQSGNGATATTYQPQDFDDPSVEERLRAIRERPFVSAEEQARAQQARLSPVERAERARPPLAALAVSAASAVGGVLLGALRRRG